MISLWKPAMFNRIYLPRNFLIDDGRYVFTNYRLNSLSDKNDNIADHCKSPMPPPPFRLPPPPPCPEPPVPATCCEANPRDHVKTSPNYQDPSGKAEGKKYTLLKDLGNKGYETFKLIKNSNEYDFAKEKLKQAACVTYEFSKKCAIMLKNRVSGQIQQMKSKKSSK